MAKSLDPFGFAGPICRVKILNSTTGAGLPALTNTSPGLRIAAICDNEATTTSYTAAGSTIDTIATLGTWVAPTSGHCRFKEIDSANHPGDYEVQLAAVRWNVAGARKILITVQVTGGVQADAEIQLTAFDPGLAAGNPGALIQYGTAAGQLATAGGHVVATLDLTQAVPTTNGRRPSATRSTRRGRRASGDGRLWARP